jgi:hypothetical protein
MTLVENKGGLVCEQAYRWYKNERGGGLLMVMGCGE